MEATSIIHVVCSLYSVLYNYFVDKAGSNHLPAAFLATVLPITPSYHFTNLQLSTKPCKEWPNHLIERQSVSALQYLLAQFWNAPSVIILIIKIPVGAINPGSFYKMRIRYYQTLVRAEELNLPYSPEVYSGMLHHSYTMFRFFEHILVCKNLQPITNSLYKRHLILL